MKKLITTVLVAAVFAAGMFATEFSVGGSLGSVIIQDTNDDDKLLRPNFGLEANLEFDNFGLQVDFDLSFISSTEKNDGTYASLIRDWSIESLLLTPYFPLKVKDWTFAIGPTLGVKWTQYKNQSVLNGSTVINVIKSDTTNFVWGGTFETRYAVNKTLSFFLNISVLGDVGETYTTTNNGVQNAHVINTFGNANIYAVPKIGLLLKF